MLSRRAVLAAAARPVGRTIPWLTAAGIVGLGWLPLAATVVRGGDDLVAAVVFGAVVAAAVVALAVDDDAAETLGAVAVPLAQRRGLRLAELVAAHATVAAAALLVAGQRDPAVGPTLGDRLVEALATGALAVAGGSIAVGRRMPGAGLTGAACGALTVGLVSVLAQRFSWLPAAGFEQHHGWWWWIALAAAVVTAWTWRDPARRRLVPWQR